MADVEFRTELSDHAQVERLIQVQGDYHAHGSGVPPVAPPTFPQFVAVPERDPRFVGRGTELDELTRRLEADAGKVVAHATVGLGGAGKSALATELCLIHPGSGGGS